VRPNQGPIAERESQRVIPIDAADAIPKVQQKIALAVERCIPSARGAAKEKAL
jgi:hypothetical protein